MYVIYVCIIPILYIYLDIHFFLNVYVVSRFKSIKINCASDHTISQVFLNTDEQKSLHRKRRATHLKKRMGRGTRFTLICLSLRSPPPFLGRFIWIAFKLENGNVAPALYFSGGGSVLATAQFSIIKDKWHRTEHSDKKKKKERKGEGERKKEKGGKSPRSRDCWPSCLSSLYKILRAKPSGVLSQLITSGAGARGRGRPCTMCPFITTGAHFKIANIFVWFTEN